MVKDVGSVYCEPFVRHRIFDVQSSLSENVLAHNTEKYSSLDVGNSIDIPRKITVDNRQI